MIGSSWVAARRREAGLKATIDFDLWDTAGQAALKGDIGLPGLSPSASSRSEVCCADPFKRCSAGRTEDDPDWHAVVGGAHERYPTGRNAAPGHVVLDFCPRR